MAKLTKDQQEYWRGVADGRKEDEKRIAELEAQLAERDWSPITQDNLPRVGDEVWRDFGEEQGGVTVEDVDADMQATWAFEDYKLEYWTHFRPINAPLAAPYGEDKTK